MSDARALQLFEAALDHPEAQRSDFVAAACGDDIALRERIERLLRAHVASVGFLEPRVVPALPRELGPYRLIEQLGAGGMGLVYLAERRDGAFEQRVAVKILAGIFASPDAIRRAEAERQFLAWVEHPNIARILDGGTTPDGQPYVVMEYVDGERIDAWCRSHALDLRARVALFGQVLAAVDAAHRALIIHRDLKPGNVMVTRDGQVKLLDFGIAKSLDANLGKDATRTGLHPLTPQYASPEQLAGRPLTTACDIYALGLLLYELLAGRSAYDTDGRSLYELERWLASHPPSRPSAQLDAAALALPRRAAIEWQRRIAGDLDRVVLKALEAEPERRYASAQAFADDLQRWLERRPVRARSGGVMYRAAKFVSRNRWAVAAAALALVALLTGLGVSLHQAERARVAAEQAQRANGFLLGMISLANPYLGGRTPTLVDALDRAVADIPQQLAGQPTLQADIRLAIGSAYMTLGRLDHAKAQIDQAVALRTSAGGTPLAQALTAQAYVEWSLGHYDAAGALYARAVPLPADDEAGRAQRSETLNDYAVLLTDTGHADEALQRVDEALRLKQALRVSPPRELAITRGNRAYVLDGLERYAEADVAYAEARALFEAIVPLPELDIATNLNNHAVVLDRLGRIDEAVALQERAVALNRQVFGEDNPRLVTPLINLARRYSSIGRHADATRAIDEALPNVANVFSANDQARGHAYAAAARVALESGDAALAVSRAEEALAIYRRAEVVEAGRREAAQAVLDEVGQAAAAVSASGR